MDSSRMPQYLLNWALNHIKRSRGRPKKNWLNCVMEDAAAFTGFQNFVLDKVKDMAEDRKRKHWRKMIRHKRGFLGAGHSND